MCPRKSTCVPWRARLSPGGRIWSGSCKARACRSVEVAGPQLSSGRPSHVFSSDRHTYPFSYRFGFSRRPCEWYHTCGHAVCSLRTHRTITVAGHVHSIQTATAFSERCCAACDFMCAPAGTLRHQLARYGTSVCMHAFQPQVLEKQILLVDIWIRVKLLVRYDTSWRQNTVVYNSQLLTAPARDRQRCCRTRWRCPSLPAAVQIHNSQGE